MRPGYRSVAAYLINPEARAIKSFAEAVFGATEAQPATMDGERLAHVAMTIGDSTVLLGAPHDGKAVETAFLHVYVADCDAAYERALAAGATGVMHPAPQPHGDRAAMVRDMGGNAWWIATYEEEVAQDEILRRQAAARA
ncbi:MAG: VOC family protein [Pseudomonadota bacterium]